jgi:hypothetical protein
MPKKPELKPELSAGQHVRIKLRSGRIVEATIRSILDRTDGRFFQVDFDKQTALLPAANVVIR